MHELMANGPESVDRPILLRLDFGEWGIISACLMGTLHQIERKSNILERPLNSNERNMADRIQALSNIIDKQVQESTGHLSVVRIKNELDEAMSIHDALGKILKSIFLEIMEEVIQKARQQ